MNLIRKSILAAGVVALVASNSYAGDIGIAYGQFQRNGGNVELKADAQLVGMTKVSNSVTGAGDFAQYKVKRTSDSKEFWLTIMEDDKRTDSTTLVRQEVFVRASNDTSIAGAAFKQTISELNASTETGTDACAKGAVLAGAGNLDCFKSNFTYKGLGADKSFEMNMFLRDANGLTKDYEQNFNYKQLQAQTPNEDCQLDKTASCPGAGALPYTTAIAGADKLVHVWFDDSIEDGAMGSFRFEGVALNPSEVNTTYGIYKYQAF